MLVNVNIKRVYNVIHADGTSRVQTVTKEDNEGFYNLLKTWKDKTGCQFVIEYIIKYKRYAW